MYKTRQGNSLESALAFVRFNKKLLFKRALHFMAKLGEGDQVTLLHLSILYLPRSASISQRTELVHVSVHFDWI